MGRVPDSLFVRLAVFGALLTFSSLWNRFLVNYCHEWMFVITDLTTFNLTAILGSYEQLYYPSLLHMTP